MRKKSRPEIRAAKTLIRRGDMKGDKTIVYKAGDAFFEPGDMTHRAYNRGKTILKVMNIEILPADYSGSALIPPTL